MITPHVGGRTAASEDRVPPPVTPGATARPGHRTEDGTAKPTGHTILLVEDDQPFRHLMTRSLEAEGYHVLKARDGLEALGLIACHLGPIDLLVTDIVMPRMDGFTLAERLAERRPETPVLLISGHSVGVRGRLKETGHSFLPKPFFPDRGTELAESVETDPWNGSPGGPLHQTEHFRIITPKEFCPRGRFKHQEEFCVPRGEGLKELL